MEDLPIGASWSIIVCVCLALAAVVLMMDNAALKFPQPLAQPSVPRLENIIRRIPHTAFEAPETRVLNSFPPNVVSIAPPVAREVDPTPPPPDMPKHDLVILKNNATYGNTFWTFKLISKSPNDRIKEDLVRVLPASDAKCMVQTFGKYAPGADLPLPLLSQGGRTANVNYIDPNGATVPVTSSIGYTNQNKDTLAIRVTLNSALPAAYYTSGVFIMFKGQDCIGGKY